MGKATQDLRNEHDAILHVLKIVDKVVSTDSKDEVEVFKFGNELIYFLKTFADKCHHGKEEDYLFKELIASGIPKEGGPIGVMLLEHQRGREYISLMSKALKSHDLINFKANAAEYRDLLRNHIEKENNALFVIADKLLDDARQNELFEKFEIHEETVVGHGIHEELHSMIHKWEDAYNVH
jgi:hemerythrin-like domain-containing protein